MPLTFFAHQAPVLPLKLARPNRFDATALCVGSMAPDLGYPLGGWIGGGSHTWIGQLTWSLPATLVICWALRRWIAEVAFAQLPDTRARLHSLRVTALRRPPLLQTVLSAAIGTTTHVVIDAFTHRERWGARWLGLGRPLGDFHLPLAGPVSTAGILQYLGHSIGSLVGLALVVQICYRRRIDEWYGPAAIVRARNVMLDRSSRILFWAVVAAALAAGVTISRGGTAGAPFFLMDALAVGVGFASAIPRCRPSPPLREPLRMGDSAVDHAGSHPQLTP
ncbi:MAG: DUF4184 family protein [Microthrixaceae bacterium]|nr:DUF4184 family protein [Microthrixaceae bacterium]